jgi:hypothetical protein
MRIFVAFGYNPRDRWIEELVFPIVEAFGSEVLSGEDMQGEQLSQGVQQRIGNSDALIAFTTRRDQLQNGTWTTHKWVQQELALAIDRGMWVAEVRETDIDPQVGVDGDRQRISYEEANRDRCLVELVKTIGRWHENVFVDLQLLPKEFIDSVKPLLRNPRLKVEYKVMEKNRETGPFGATIKAIKGGLFMTAANIHREALIQVFVECDGSSWNSDYESVNSIGIKLY